MNVVPMEGASDSGGAAARRRKSGAADDAATPHRRLSRVSGSKRRTSTGMRWAGMASAALLLLLALASWMRSGSKHGIKALGRGNRVPVVLVEQHGEVLKFWLDALKDVGQEEHVMVVHVDSHSDYMDVQDYPARVRKVMAASRPAEDIYLQHAGIGDFITRAVFAQRVRSVYWVRSDFVDGEYNGPAPGRYKINVSITEPPPGEGNVASPQDRLAREQERVSAKATVEAALKAPGLSLRQSRQPLDTPGGAVKVDGDEDDEDEDDYEDEDGDNNAAEYSVLCFPTLKRVEDWTGSVASKRGVEAILGCEGDLEARRKEFELLVSTTSVMFDAPDAASHWILDLDLDFFSTFDPSLALFEHHGFPSDFVRQSFQSAFKCPGNNENTDMSHLQVIMSRLPKEKERLTVDFIDMMFGLIDSKCRVSRKKRAMRLVEAVKRFTPEQDQAWAALFASDIFDWTGDFLQALLGPDAETSPTGQLSESEILAEVHKLESALLGIKARLGDPAIITVSRSQVMDHYLPPHLAPFIQHETFAMLRRLFKGRLEDVHYNSDVAAAFRTEGPQYVVEA